MVWYAKTITRFVTMPVVSAVKLLFEVVCPRAVSDQYK